MPVGIHVHVHGCAVCFFVLLSDIITVLECVCVYIECV